VDRWTGGGGDFETPASFVLTLDLCLEGGERGNPHKAQSCVYVYISIYKYYEVSRGALLWDKCSSAIPLF